MARRPILAMVRKDLQLFFTDRRAVIMTIVAPIAIASFFGSIFSGNNGEPAKIPVAIVDQDGSAIAKGILAGAQGDKNLQVTVPGVDEARAQVKAGTVSVAVVIPPGFGDASGRAFFAAAVKPSLTMWYDPSRAAELGLVRGILTEHVMQSVSAEMFTGEQGRTLVDDTLTRLDQTTLSGQQQTLLRNLLESARKFYNEPAAEPSATTAGAAPARRGISMPYTVAEEAVTSGDNVAYNGYAHSFAGMSIQFLLFASIDLGVGILLERQRGLWKRLRSAPVSRTTLLLGKAASGALLSLMSLATAFAFAIIVFGVRISGSLPGFVLVALATAAMASTFGLLIAAIGRTPGGTRGIASLAVLLMVMLGGAWVPSFIFPAWLQRVTVVIPARWAVDGFDAMTWRGLGFDAALLPSAVMLGFAVLFGSLALARFRWEE
ncbi:MAG TPA: ABC transporter permease [Vicinamibacterales bacterium]|nr:ABC transporter permease [Vicinamibacterales bacterium]